MKRFIGGEDGVSGYCLPILVQEKMYEKMVKLGPRRDTTPQMLEEARCEFNH